MLLEDRGESLVVCLHPDRDLHENAADWIRRHYTEVLEESVSAVRPNTIVEFRYDIAQEEQTG